MKKLIVGLSLAALAVPSVQAWASADDVRTAQANKQRPVVRVKHEYTKTVALNKYQQTVPCNCSGKPTGWQRSARVLPVKPQEQVAQKVQRGAVTHPLYVNNVQRVVSEKVYMQKVTRIPVAPATCPKKR